MIDVILPTYNQASTLGWAIASILNQTFKDFRLIIVNDGSSDYTKDVLAGFTDERISVIEHQTNKGLPKSLNDGHAAGCRPWCTWVSSDNISEPDHLEKLLHEAEFADFVRGNFSIYYNISRNIDHIDTSKHPGPLGLGNLGAAFLYRREIWQKFKYDETMQGVEDLKFFLQAKLCGHYTFAHVPESLVRYYSHTNSLSGRMGTAKLQGLEKELREQLGLK